MNSAEEDLQQFLEDQEVESQEKKKLRALLPNEVWQGRCSLCGKLAIRIFPPRRGLTTIEKQKGIAGVMDVCKTNQKNQRVLIDTPCFNAVITGHHGVADGFNLAQGTASRDCDNILLTTDSPRDLVWHVFSRLRAVRTACMLNGITYAEVKAWFDTLDSTKASLLMPRIITFDLINDPDQKLIGGPWYTAWIDTSQLHTVETHLFSRHVNADPAWDNCVDPFVGTQLDVTLVDYNSTPEPGDHLFDATKYQLDPFYVGSSILMGTVEPAGSPGKYLKLKTSFGKEAFPANVVTSAFVHLVPTQYWTVDASRLRKGMNPSGPDDPNFIDMSR